MNDQQLKSIRIEPTVNGWLVSHNSIEGSYGQRWSFETMESLIVALPKILAPNPTTSNDLVAGQLFKR